MAKPVDLGSIKEESVVGQGPQGNFNTDVRSRYKVEEPKKEEKKRGPRKRKFTKKKTFNLNIPLAEYIENYCFENDISETDFVNDTLEKVFKIKKETPKKESK